MKKVIVVIVIIIAAVVIFYGTSSKKQSMEQKIEKSLKAELNESEFVNADTEIESVSVTPKSGNLYTGKAKLVNIRTKKSCVLIIDIAMKSDGDTYSWKVSDIQ